MTGWFMNGLRFCVALVMLLVTQQAFAVGLSNIEQLTAGERDKVTAILFQQQRNLHEVCKDIKLLKAEAVSVQESLALADSGKPTAGAWTVRYSVDACGEIRKRSAGFKVMQGGIAIDPLAPGETLADPKLQADVMGSFRMAGQVSMPQCGDEVTVRDTKIQVMPAKPTDRWVELWIGEMCGRDLAHAVEFMPTKNGTTFKMTLPVKTDKK